MCTRMKLYIFSSFKLLWMVLFLWYTSMTKKLNHQSMYTFSMFIPLHILCLSVNVSLLLAFEDIVLV